MNLAEVIKHEREVYKLNQKIVDTHIAFDDVSIEELYCDDTEVIEECLEKYQSCANYHKQISEWLENYKHMRFQIGEILVDVDKQNITSDMGIEKIRDVVRKYY